MIDLRNVQKRFGAQAAVCGVDLNCETSEAQALIGPSGCGTSTLLRMMVGLVVPDQGEVIFDGRPLAQSNIMQSRQRIGYVIQEGGLFPHLTVRLNATIMPRFLNSPANKAEARLQELLALVRLPADLLDRY